MSAAEKLSPEVTTTDLITVESKPALISVNFDEVKAWLETELQKYDVVVTADTLADAKKLATELNKNASEFDKRRKDAVAQVSGPIKQFETQMKQLVSMCKDGRQRILDQVQKFEDEVREKAKPELERARLETWEQYSVDAEFRRAQIDDLVKLTALTKAGNLTAGTANELKSRVAADKQLQDRTNMRLVMLENQSYKAGLSAPLTRDHVNSFLFADDEQYQVNLDRIIESELRRQEQAETAMRARLEREQQQAQQVATEPQQPVETSVAEPDVPIQTHSPSAGEPGYRALTTAEPAALADTGKHAIGPLLAPRNACVSTSTREDAERNAANEANAEPWGVWIPGALVAICYRGEVFRKA